MMFTPRKKNHDNPECMNRLDIVEFLKGYSIFTIIVFHYLQTVHLTSPFDKLIFFGGTGVHLFVLLSGFGLYISYASKPLPYPLYLKKRLSKIYIPYIIVILISAALALFIPIYDTSLYALGGHVFLYKMFDERIVGSYGYPLWFVSMILQFYLVFYVLVFFTRAVSLKTFLMLSLFASIAWIAFIIGIDREMERVWNSFFLRYLWEFALGMVLADYFMKNDFRLHFNLKPFYLLWAGVINCALYAFLALKGGSIGAMINDIPALIGYASVAVWIYLLSIRPLNNFFIFAGNISFALYLLHTVVLLLFLYFANAYPVTLAIALLTTFAVSVVYTRFINRLYKGIGV